MKFSPFNFALAVAMLLSCLSCKKKAVDETISKAENPLFTVTFADNFIPDQYKAIIFISGPDGSTIADTTCTANGTYNLFLKEGTIIPPGSW